MTLELYVTSQRKLRVRSRPQPDGPAMSADPALARIERAFERGDGAGLLHLATGESHAALSPSLGFARGPPFLVLSLKAGGSGLNLTAASQVIHFDRWWNPAVENQATDRAFRIGQTRNVLVHKFVCRGTVEERIDTLIESKSSLARELIDGAAEQRVTEMSDAELLDLVRLDIHKACEA